jgi:uncharacterized membrane protein YfhO
MLVNVQVTHDDGWEALQDGKSVGLSRGQLGFIYIHARPSANSRITLHYNGTIEQRLMAVISVFAWVLAGVGLRRSLKKRVSAARNTATAVAG